MPRHLSLLPVLIAVASCGPGSGSIELPPPAWGFADLHAHPATHLSFGAHNDGSDDGLFWGKPGLALEDARRTLPEDLGLCDGNMHGGEADPITHRTHEDLIKSMNFITGLPHAPSGRDNFRAWPHSQSILHEQMHVTAIRRAYEGGLRLMVASVTGNQLMGDRLWRGDHDTPSRALEYESARAQLDFIQELVDQNRTWMQVVRTPLEARLAIRDGKLAVVLGVEMDSLNASDLVSLSGGRSNVRTVIPVHLADNESFGGTAVYGDLFNANSHFLTGRHFRVVGDPNLEFRLGRPQELVPGPLGSVSPASVSITRHCQLGYEPCPEIPGHVAVPWNEGMKNAVGLNKHELRRLMRRGLIVDLAHMGEFATEDALDLADQFDYPLMFSHGGLRHSGGNERALLASQATRLAERGGVLGLGTEGDVTPRVVATAQGHRFAGSARTFEVSLDQHLAERFELSIVTGVNDLSASESATATLELAGRAPIVVPLNAGAAWATGSTNVVTIPLPSAVPVTDVVRLVVRLDGVNPVWDVQSLRLVGVTGRAARLPLVTAIQSPNGAPFVRLSAANPSWTRQLRLAPETPVARVILRIRNSTDTYVDPNESIRGTLKSTLTGTVFLSDRRGIDLVLNAGSSWPAESINERTFTLPPEVTAGQVESLRLRFLGDTNWDVANATVLLETPAGERFTVYGDTSSFRMTPGAYLKSLPLQPREPVPLDQVVAALRLNFAVTDEMDSSGIDIPVTITTTSGDTVTGTANLGGRLRDGGLTRMMYRMPPGVTVGELDRLVITSHGTDDWQFADLSVEVLSDPVANWTREYAETLAAMGDRGVALGTDLNGLAPQVPYTSSDVPETIDVASSRAPEHLASTTPALTTSSLGATPLRFEDRGLAHYGMLPDFLQAVSMQAEGATAMTGLFRSAEDFIAMWDRIEAAKQRVRDNPDTTPVRELRITVTTGVDDLRCDSNATAYVAFTDGTEVTTSLGSSLGMYTPVTRELALPSPRPLHELQYFGIRANLSNGDASPCAGLSPDNWSVEIAQIEFKNPGGGWETLMFRRGHPLKRMDHGEGNQEWRDLL